MELRRPTRRVVVAQSHARSITTISESETSLTASVVQQKDVQSISDTEAQTEVGDVDEPPAKKRRTNAKKSNKTNTDATIAELLESSSKRVKSAWKVGAHVSAAGGVENAVFNAAKIGANSFALFLKSQRKWVSPPLTETSISAFKERMVQFGYEPKHVLPHGSYLINLGNPDAEKRAKSYECFLDDLQRCELLGLELYNFHPGSSVGAASIDETITNIAECLNKAHKATSSIITVLENMAGAGNIIGGDFKHLGKIIERVDDKERVGVCFDTCHAFAAGYDIRTPSGWSATMQTFDTQIGLKYLRGMHINDSKTELGSRKDRHENVGLGHLSLPTFHHILNDARTRGIPLILETPSQERDEIWRIEIGVLNSFSPGQREVEAETRAEVEGTSGADGVEGVVRKGEAEAEMDMDMLKLEESLDLIRGVVGEREEKPKAKKVKVKKAGKGKGKKAGKKGGKNIQDEEEDEEE